MGYTSELSVKRHTPDDPSFTPLPIYRVMDEKGTILNEDHDPNVVVSKACYTHSS